MTRWMWGAVLLAGGCVVVEDDDKVDTGTTDTDTDTVDTDTGTEPVDPDNDADGFPASVDCNDADAAINPDAPENCDGIDNNCNTNIDDEFAVTLGTTNYATVDEALAAAVDGDTLVVCPGNFELASSIAPTGALTLQAIAGREATSLAVTGGGPVAALEGSANLTLEGFTLSGSVGSAIDLQDSSTLNLKASRLTANGRGISLVGSPSVTVSIEGSTIDLNDAGNDDGGAILAEGSFAISLTDSDLTGNNAANGGAIFARVVFGQGTISLTNSNIDGNSADIGGGVVLQNVPLTGDSISSIVNNTALTAGGGVAMYRSSLDSVLVSTNNAPAGGGVAALSDVDFLLAPLQNPLTTVVVDSNTADLGAGIWVDEGEPMSVDAYSAVTVNTATTAGGGAYLDGDESTFSSAGADFGAAGVNDNAPDDVATIAGPFIYEPGAVFTCTGELGCEDAATTP